MNRQALLAALTSYSPTDPHEKEMVSQTISFVDAYPDCFERTLLIGHVTASAWVVNPERSHVLLIHHVKLGRWLQPGGHCDGDPDVLAVAQKETLEETGVAARPVSTAIFDVDIHPIPPRKDIPEHLHYDIRFLLEAPLHDSMQRNESEVHDAQWVPLAEVNHLNSEESVLRMVRKTSTA